MIAPRMPTAAEKPRHEVDHCPCQAWCRSCVAVRGKADAHFRRESAEDGVAYIAMEFAVMGEKVEDDRVSDKCLPILVHKFYEDRRVTSHVVEHKEADEWAAKMATHRYSPQWSQRVCLTSSSASCPSWHCSTKSPVFQ